MSNVALWNVQAGLNTGAPPSGAPEHMLRSDVNNVMREMMAAIARWYADVKPSTLVTFGTTDTYSLTTANTFVALTDIPVLVFRVHRTNTGPMFLNVDGLGAKPVFKATGSTPFSSGEVIGGATTGQIMAVAYNTAIGAFELIGPRPPRDGFASSTVMLFQMATPPLGWAPVTLNHDAAVRIVNDATGGQAGGSVAASVVFGDRIIDRTNLPNTDIELTNLTTSNPGGHTHGTGGNSTHKYFLIGDQQTGKVPADASGIRSTFNQTDAQAVTDTDTAGGHVHTVSGHLYLNGNVTQVPMDFKVKYVNVVAAVRL